MKINVNQTAPLPPLHPRAEENSSNSVTRAINGLGRFLVLGGSSMAKMVLDPKSLLSDPAKGGGLANNGFSDLQELLRMQASLQREMQDFTMRSNISRTEHESRMTAVRNMRA